MFVIFVRTNANQAQKHQIFMYYFNIPNINMSGSPFFQKTSVKKNQKRFHQQNIYTDPDPNNNKPIKEYNHITTCLYTHRTEPQTRPK
jgi:hypothetical protein